MTSPDDSWQPFCGAEFGRDAAGGLDLGTAGEWSGAASRIVAGDPVVCDIPPHDDTVQHRCTELGFGWW
jgi:hypothetical protein